jgi:regulator of sigma E protease
MNQKSETLQNIVLVIAALAAAVFFWDTVKGLLIFACTLGVLIAIHEWGHFIAARFAGVRIYEFAIGMGPRAWTYWHKNGTDYTIHWLPVGGFVHMKGMQPEDPATPDGVNGRRPAERALIYLAGPLMNVIFGTILALTMGWMWGTDDPSQVYVGQFDKRTPASQMQVISVNGQPASGKQPLGLQVGDRVLAVNDKAVRDFEDVVYEISPNAGKAISIKVKRGRNDVVLQGVPARNTSPREQFLTVMSIPADADLPIKPGDQIDRIDGETTYLNDVTLDERVAEIQKKLRDKAGQPITLGIWRNDSFQEVRGKSAPLKLAMQKATRHVGQLKFTPTFGAGPRISLAESAQQGMNGILGMLLVYKGLFSRPTELRDNLSGPLGIWTVLAAADKLPLLHYMNLLASISFSLAIFNLFPVPILDGGHMLLLSFEVIRRRRLEPNMLRAAQLVGLVFIGTLFLFIFGKDWLKHFG